MRWQRAPAKINLTLRVLGRRDDGYHELESLVAFAGLGDWLGFEPDDDLTLEVFGPRADQTGPVEENLVMRAARALAAHAPGLRLGRFRLIKRLPAAAGLGGGSADAAAALRLLADESGLSIDDPRVRASALATGADVLACLSPQARNHERHRRSARSGDSPVEHFRGSGQPPGSGADAQGFRRAWPRAWVEAAVSGLVVSRGDI